MSKITLKDSVNLNDSCPLVKGVVVLKDSKTGKIIFKKNNIIVGEGREFLKDLLFTQFTGNTTNAKKVSSICIYVGTDVVVPTAEDTVASLTNRVKLISGVSGDSMSWVSASKENAEEKYLCFSLKVQGSGTTSFNMASMGIALNLISASSTDDGSEESGGEEILFSHIVFDPLPFTSSNTYDLDYFLYF